MDGYYGDGESEQLGQLREQAHESDMSWQWCVLQISRLAQKKVLELASRKYGNGLPLVIGNRYKLVPKIHGVISQFSTISPGIYQPV